MQRGYRGIAGSPVKPYVEFSVYIGSDVWLNLTFLDRNKNPSVPVSVNYRIDDLTTDDLVLDSTPYTGVLASQISINIPASINTIVSDTGQSSQINQVTVTAVFADGSTTQSVHVYELIAIQTIGGGTSPTLA
jgi:hypothetical protein